MNNSIKSALAARRRVYGCWLSLASPIAAEALAHAGFDFLVVDTEHAPGDTMDVIAQLQAIGNGGAHAIVRVTENQPLLVKRAMDAGAATILFPAVNSADDAQRAAASMRYPQPDEKRAGIGGMRGVGGSVRAARYGFDRDYLAGANEAACTIVQIESRQALQHVDAIAAVDGIDALFVGPADLAASLGHLGDTTHPDVQQAIVQIAQAAARRNIATGIYCGSVEAARNYLELGFTLVALASELTWMLKGARDALAGARG